MGHQGGALINNSGGVIVVETGRPTDYDPKYCDIARVMCELGAIDKDIARALDVTEQTINNWKLKHPAFFESLKLGKSSVDERVKQALVHRALGYSHPEDDIRTVSNPNGGSEIVITPTTKHYPPSETACIFWLKNRIPTEFRANPEPGDSDYVAPVKIEVNVVDARVDKPAP